MQRYHRTSGLCALVAFVAMLAIAQAQPRITSLSSVAGSLAGGTRIYVRGENFSPDMYTGVNRVFIGGLECTVIPYYTSSEQIACDTAPSTREGRFSVRVDSSTKNPLTGVEGAATSSDEFCCFEYKDFYTPTLMRLEPDGILAGEQVTLRGNDRGAFDLDEDNGLNEVEFMRIGDSICRVDEVADFSATSGLSPEDAATATAAVGLPVGQDPSGFYFVRCDMPGPGDNDAAVGGVKNVTARFIGDDNNVFVGDAQVRATDLLRDFLGRPYRTEVVPTVEDIYPRAGSLGGSTPLVITGTGFPDIPRRVRDPETTTVTWRDPARIFVGGRECVVQKSSFAEMVCLTANQTAAPAAAGAVDGKVPGGRGLRQHRYQNMDAVSGRYSDATWAAGISKTLGAPAALANISEIVFSPLSHFIWEPTSTNDERRNYMHVMEAFFQPPVTGTYFFRMVSDDQAKVTLRVRNETGGTNATTLFDVTQWRRYEDWDSNGRSQPVQLSQDVPVLLTMAYQNGNGPGHGRLGVEIPSSGATADSKPNRQRIKISAERSGALLTVRVDTAPAGASQVPLCLFKSVGGTPRTPGLILADINATSFSPIENEIFSWAQSNTTNGRPASNYVKRDRGFDPATGKDYVTLAINWDYDDVATEAFVADPSCTLGAPGLSSANVNVTFYPGLPFWDPAADFVNLSWKNISLGDSNETQISPLATRRDVLDALARIGVATGVDVEVEREPDWGTFRLENIEFASTRYFVDEVTTVTITFDPLTYPYAIEQANASIAGNVTAIKPRVTTSVLSTFESLRLLLPIPGNMLRVPMPEPSAARGSDVRVYINQALASFGNRTHQKMLDFTYSSVLTPQLTQVSPQTGGAGTVLTLTGTGFSSATANVSVEIGGARCEVTAASATSITCTLREGGIAGRHPVRVGFRAVGLARVSDADRANTLFNLSIMKVNGVSPTTVAANTKFTMLRINGSGFDFEDCSKHTVRVSGSAPCHVVGCTATSVSCLLDASTLGAASNRSVEVSLRGETEEVHPMDQFFRRRLSATAWSESVVFYGISTVLVGAPAITQSKPFSYAAQYYRAGVLTTLPPGAPRSGSLPGTNSTISLQTLAFNLTNSTVGVENGTELYMMPAAPVLGGSLTRPYGAFQGKAWERARLRVHLHKMSGDYSYVLWSPSLFTTVNGTNSTANSTAGANSTANSTSATVIRGSGPLVQIPLLETGEWLLTAHLANGTILAAPEIFTPSISVSSVVPASGSTGGGQKIKVSGWGFATRDNSNGTLEAVTMVTVPVSTTFPSGKIECLVDHAKTNDVELYCDTQAHCAKNADRNDPMAIVNCQHLATNPAPIDVVSCGDNLSVQRRFQCWGWDETARANCTSPTSCLYAYSESDTMVVTRVIADLPAPYTGRYGSAAVTYGGLTVSLSGRGFRSDCVVYLILADGTRVQPSTINVVSTTSITFTAPDLGAGQYGVLVNSPSVGNALMGPGGRGLSIAYATIVTSVTNKFAPSQVGPLGSVAGGTTLRIEGAGAGFASGDADRLNTLLAAGRGLWEPEAGARWAKMNNEFQIAVGNLPCRIVNLTRYALDCVTDRPIGFVTEEFYGLSSSRNFPNFANLLPTSSDLSDSVDVTWGSGSPVPTVQTDYFGVVWKGAYRATTAGNYTFQVNCDDLCQVYIDGTAVFSEAERFATVTRTLTVGWHDFRMEYQEWTGWARSRLYVRTPTDSSPRSVPGEVLSAVRPGVPAPVSVKLGGVPAIQNCTAQRWDFSADLSSEASAWSASRRLLAAVPTGGPCYFEYTGRTTPIVKGKFLGAFNQTEIDMVANAASWSTVELALLNSPRRITDNGDPELQTADDVIVLFGSRLNITAPTVAINGTFGCQVLRASQSAIVCKPDPLAEPGANLNYKIDVYYNTAGYAFFEDSWFNTNSDRDDRVQYVKYDTRLYAVNPLTSKGSIHGGASTVLVSGFGIPGRIALSDATIQALPASFYATPPHKTHNLPPAIRREVEQPVSVSNAAAVPAQPLPWLDGHMTQFEAFVSVSGPDVKCDIDLELTSTTVLACNLRDVAGVSGSVRVRAEVRRRRPSSSFTDLKNPSSDADFLLSSDWTPGASHTAGSLTVPAQTNTTIRFNVTAPALMPGPVWRLWLRLQRAPGTPDDLGQAHGVYECASVSYSNATGTPQVSCNGPALPAATWDALVYAVNDTAIQTPRYTLSAKNETLTVGTKAFNYTVGHAQPLQFTVPLDISGVQLAAGQRVWGSSAADLVGSTRGGLDISIKGKGWSLNKDEVVVMIGNVSAPISDLNLTCLNFTTPALPNGTYNVSLTTIRGARPVVVGEFSALDRLTPNVTHVDPHRGTSQGNELINVYGTQLQYTDYVEIGDGSWVKPGENVDGRLRCTSLIVYSDTHVACRVPKPPRRVAGRLEVRAHVSGLGFSRAVPANATAFTTFQYVDLWSRLTTWGGTQAGVPVEGDSIIVPEGQTLVMDISPPRLRLILLEGDLEFDEEAVLRNQPLQLQADYILILGGAFRIGTHNEPYKGQATVTMHGHPEDTQELPVYGSKVIGVRHGELLMHGMEKRPTWLRLVETATPGSNTLKLENTTNWQVGDKIVVAPSSIHAHEVDEVNITAITNNADGTSTLTVSPALQYTHLGVVTDMDGNVITPTPRGYIDYGRKLLDHRAEVGILTRNVVFEGDESSARFQFGAQILAHTHGAKGVSTIPRAVNKAAYLNEYGPLGNLGGRSPLNILNVEVRNAGQAFRLGRYPIHFHLQGSTNSTIRGNSIHHTFNRALTVHGSHGAIVENNVAFNNMGHAFFLEDGIEVDNVFRNNLGMLTRRSHSLLNTDTTPATFWITNPRNDYFGNVAAGSLAYGFWYRMLTNPEGPSTTSQVFPKFMELGEFVDNVAHSNLIYGFRVHPEFYPSATPQNRQARVNCFGQGCSSSSSSSNSVPAVFRELRSYKNGMKGAVLTQVGLVQMKNLTIFDNGAGPFAHVVNGKDHGGGIEFTWIVDYRNHWDMRLRGEFDKMSGVENAFVITRTAAGQAGTASNGWVSGRGIRGIITNSAESPDFRSLMWINNVTMIGWTGGQYHAFETCGKCKSQQGGFHTYMSNVTTVPPALLPGATSGTRTSLHGPWAWSFQGVLYDLDGTMLGERNRSLHAPMNIFRPSDLVPGNLNNYYITKPNIEVRRFMLNSHRPNSIRANDLIIGESNATTPQPRPTFKPFSKYNDAGYQFYVPTTHTVLPASDINGRPTLPSNASASDPRVVLRQFDLAWNVEPEVSPTEYDLHRIDDGFDDDHVWFRQRSNVNWTRWTVSGRESIDRYPVATDPHGTSFYNLTRDNLQDVNLYFLARGGSRSDLNVNSHICPVGGCPTDTILPPAAVVSNGTQKWSSLDTWRQLGLTNSTGGPRLPVTGDSITIPPGFELRIDVDTPVMERFTVFGNVSFAPGDWRLEAKQIIVKDTGVLMAGDIGADGRQQAFNGRAKILVHGSRNVINPLQDREVNFGDKFFAVINGTVMLKGRTTGRRWTRLTQAVSAGATSPGGLVLNVDPPVPGWTGSSSLRAVLTSSFWNPNEAEEVIISEVRNGGSQVVVRGSLKNNHLANATTVDRVLYNHEALLAKLGNQTIVTSAELGLLDHSSVVVAAADPADQGYVHPVDAFTPFFSKKDLYGVSMVVTESARVSIDSVYFHHCGQFGFSERACLRFHGAADPALRTGGFLTNPQIHVRNSAFDHILGAGAHFDATSGGIVFENNVLWGGWDTSTVMLAGGRRNVIRDNLGVGTRKIMEGKSSFDLALPAVFDAQVAGNIIQGNVAAGSDRIGFYVAGDNCGRIGTPAHRLANNTAHGALVGMILVQGLGLCTSVDGFTAHHNWDFGVLTMRGITGQDVHFNRLKLSDNKHAGILVLKRGQTGRNRQGRVINNPIEWDHSVTVSDSLIMGYTSTASCQACRSNSDAACHQNLSKQSYRNPRQDMMGFVAATFALSFTPGPEMKPWDGLKGYPTILGRATLDGVTFANFAGSASDYSSFGVTCDINAYALAPHAKAPDAFHPHYLKNSAKVNVPLSGMLKMIEPDPGWRRPSDCDIATYRRKDGSTLPLNCDGLEHTYFKDIDGTFFGLIGTVNGAQLSGRRALEEQGTITPGLGLTHTDPNFDLPTFLASDSAGGPCYHSAGLGGGGSLCASGFPQVTATQPRGKFGDLQLLVIHTLDVDSEDRNFSPVKVTTDGYTDLLVTKMDHGWCFGYTCQKRLSTFWTYVPMGQQVDVNFTGTPGKFMRYYLPDASPSAEVVFRVNYYETLNRFAWAEGSRLSPTSSLPAVGDGTPSGAYFWDQTNTIFTMKMKGGAVVEIRTERTVKVSLRLTVDVTDFYNRAADVRRNLAALLGIPAAQFKLVNPVAAARMLQQSTTAPVNNALNIEISEPDRGVIASQDVDRAASMDAEDQTRLLPANETVRNAELATVLTIDSQVKAAESSRQAAAASSESVSTTTPETTPPAATTAPPNNNTGNLGSALEKLSTSLNDGGLVSALVAIDPTQFANLTVSGADITVDDPNLLVEAGLKNVTDNATTGIVLTPQNVATTPAAATTVPSTTAAPATAAPGTGGSATTPGPAGPQATQAPSATTLPAATHTVRATFSLAGVSSCAGNTTSTVEATVLAQVNPKPVRTNTPTCAGGRRLVMEMDSMRYAAKSSRALQQSVSITLEMLFASLANANSAGSSVQAAVNSGALLQALQAAGIPVTGVAVALEILSPQPSSGTPRDTDDGVNVGVIVGAVVGGIAGLAILIGIFVLIAWRRKQHRAPWTSVGFGDGMNQTLLSDLSGARGGSNTNQAGGVMATSGGVGGGGRLPSGAVGLDMTNPTVAPTPAGGPSGKTYDRNISGVNFARDASGAYIPAQTGSRPVSGKSNRVTPSGFGGTMMTVETLDPVNTSQPRSSSGAVRPRQDVMAPSGASVEGQSDDVGPARGVPRGNSRQPLVLPPPIQPSGIDRKQTEDMGRNWEPPTPGPVKVPSQGGPMSPAGPSHPLAPLKSVKLEEDAPAPMQPKMVVPQKKLTEALRGVEERQRQ
ncbi:unnamed protein product [Pedinophyceae sp. YPF-701]|nr:unnamed protein product [Pedinophyceae sp. YPF-701]